MKDQFPELPPCLTAGPILISVCTVLQSSLPTHYFPLRQLELLTVKRIDRKQIKFLSFRPSSLSKISMCSILCNGSVHSVSEGCEQRFDRRPLSIQGMSCSCAFPWTADVPKIVTLSKFKHGPALFKYAYMRNMWYLCT